MMTLRQDGWRKVLAGVTTPMEVMNVTAKEDFAAYKDQAIPVLSPPDIKTGSSDLKPAAAAYTISSESLSPSKEYEARIYPRVNEKVDIRYSMLTLDAQNPNLLKSDNMEHAALTHDISAGGLRFSSAATIAVGTILGLQIHIEKNERSIGCLAKVSRDEEDSSSSSKEKGKFNIMVYYLDISSADRVKLTQFVKNKMNKN